MCPYQLSARRSSTHYEGEVFAGRIQSIHCIHNNWTSLLNHILEVSHLQTGKERAVQKKKKAELQKLGNDGRTFRQLFLCEAWGNSDGPCAQWVSPQVIGTGLLCHCNQQAD